MPEPMLIVMPGTKRGLGELLPLRKLQHAGVPPVPSWLFDSLSASRGASRPAEDPPVLSGCSTPL